MADLTRMSKDLLNGLTDFMVTEIGEKALDGVTYTMILKNDKNKEAIERCKAIKQEAVKCGYVKNEIFRVYELGNGYIFDMDIDVTKMLTKRIVMTLNQTQGSMPNPDIISDMIEKRRKRDMLALSRFALAQFKENRTQFEVALYSKNRTNRIMINGKGPNNEQLCITYNAYVVRHWDIEIINEKILIPNGIRISRIQPYEILPSKTGVSFLFTLEAV